MDHRVTAFTPPIDCGRMESPAFTVVDSTRYDFRAILADFNQYKGPATKPSPKRSKTSAIRQQKPHRSPFRNNYWERSPQPSSAAPSASPPASPKRRKTEVHLESYTGDQYEIDFGRVDLCARIRLLRTAEDTSDEEALTWSSSDEDEDEDESIKSLLSSRD